MKRTGILATIPLAAVLFTTGCSQQRYYAAPPPPPPAAFENPLVDQARHNGFRMGEENGARDAYNGWGYHPNHDRAFHDTPGYDPRFGPFSAYQGYFRDAYLRGYDRGFNRR